MLDPEAVLMAPIYGDGNDMDAYGIPRLPDLITLPKVFIILYILA